MAIQQTQHQMPQFNRLSTNASIRALNMLRPATSNENWRSGVLEHQDQDQDQDQRVLGTATLMEGKKARGKHANKSASRSSAFRVSTSICSLSNVICSIQNTTRVSDGCQQNIVRKYRADMA
jgi:hypothetical protein